MMTEHPPDSEPTESAPSESVLPEPQPPRVGRLRRLHRWAPLWLKVAGAVVATFVLLVSVSFLKAITASNNLTVSERAAEWARDNHLGPVVNKIENGWFTANAPKASGTPDREIDGNGSTGSTAAPTAVPHLEAPSPVQVPDGVTPVPNEGVWQPAGPLVGGAQAMYTTQVRPDSVHTSLLSGLAWMDPQLVRFELYPGTTEPGGKWAEPSKVPAEQVPDLMAAFNSGFRMQDANGGFYLDGVTKGDLRDGAASFVIYRDGTATVGMWGRDVTMTPDVVAVRQNLDLIIDNGGGAPNVAGKPAADAAPGVPADGLDDNANGAWGDTLGNKVLVWRSGVCVTASGAVVFGYGDGLGALSLSELLMRAGCVRAMELDINKSWTTFNTYGATTFGDPGSVHGTKLLPEQVKGGDRYLSTDARDFIAVLDRDLPVPGAAPKPTTTTPPTTAPRRPSTTTTTRPRTTTTTRRSAPAG